MEKYPQRKSFQFQVKFETQTDYSSPILSNCVAKSLVTHVFSVTAVFHYSICSSFFNTNLLEIPRIIHNNITAKRTRIYNMALSINFGNYWQQFKVVSRSRQLHTWSCASAYFPSFWSTVFRATSPVSLKDRWSRHTLSTGIPMQKSYVN